MSVCDNCYTTDGPFLKLQTYYLHVQVCKNTKEDQNRLSKCVERRVKIDNERYKETYSILNA